ncbi:Uncharacterised protein [Clostridioides difficile]|nr:Hypothetical protein pJMR5-1_0005 [Clostridioides difficile]SJP17782.1 Uncharacterised protein [Clostridioides difficile]SJP21472.1 Uncharacterised protein [Clostridioides difficile]SJP23109.1 Uncharacterised protein [Clostridioides difficile]SJR62085.1 Uncharacterised protein [Clostridioides difficile]
MINNLFLNIVFVLAVLFVFNKLFVSFIDFVICKLRKNCE